jgi:hypothetical protein
MFKSEQQTINNNSKDVKVCQGDVSKMPKKSTCQLIELYYRISGELLSRNDAT